MIKGMNVLGFDVIKASRSGRTAVGVSGKHFVVLKSDDGKEWIFGTYPSKGQAVKVYNANLN